MPWLVRGSQVLASLEVAEARKDRRRGLIGRDGIDGALLLRPAGWVHTVGVRFPIDVAHLDRDLRVIRVTRMRRYRIGMPVPRAKAVLEAEAGEFERWGLAVGDELEVRA